MNKGGGATPPQATLTVAPLSRSVSRNPTLDKSQTPLLDSRHVDRARETGTRHSDSLAARIRGREKECGAAHEEAIARPHRESREGEREGSEGSKESTTVIGFPKPERRVLDRLDQKKARDRASQAFRQEVWLRDESRCRHCGRIVIRTIELVPNRGEVHHRRGRNVAVADRYNPARALLLCNRCHSDQDVIALYRK